MFGKVLDFIYNITFTTCTKQISESEKTLKYFERGMKIRSECNNLLKLYMQKDTFPFLTNLDFTTIDENLAIEAMNKVDYIKVLYIPKCGHALTHTKEYFRKRLEICEIIKKHQDTIEVLDIDISIFYILNIMGVKLINCKYFSINIHDHGYFVKANDLVDYYSKIYPDIDCEKDIKNITLNISLKNLKDFEIIVHSNWYSLDSITINQHMDRLEYIGVNYSKDPIDCINICFNPNIQVLPSLKISMNAISDFHNIHFPVLKKIFVENVPNFSTDMIPNVEEISMRYPTKNIFEKGETFSKLKKLSVDFYWRQIIGNGMTFPEFLCGISKMPSITILDLKRCLNYPETYDFSSLEINKSLEIIKTDSRFISTHKNILREKFPNLIKLAYSNLSDEALYANNLLFKGIEKLNSVVDISGPNIIVNDPNFDIFETFHYSYHGSISDEILRKPGLFTNKKLVFIGNLRFFVNLPMYFPDYREISFYQNPKNISSTGFIAVRYNNIDEVVRFLKLIKTNSYISLQIIDSSNIKIYFRVDNNVHEECLFSAQISDFIEKIKDTLPN